MSALPSIQILTEAGPAGVLLEPTRLRLIEELREPGSASTLARKLGEPRQRINYHLRELEKAGLLRLVEERKRGNCVERIVVATARTYLVSPEVLGALGSTPAQVQDRLSSAYLVAVCAEAIRELGTVRARAQRAGKKVATLTVQTEVRFASQEAMSAFAAEASEALAQIAARHHSDSAPDGRLFKFFLAGYPAITKNEDGSPIQGAPMAPDASVAPVAPPPTRDQAPANPVVTPPPGGSKKPSDLLKGLRP